MVGPGKSKSKGGLVALLNMEPQADFCEILRKAVLKKLPDEFS